MVNLHEAHKVFDKCSLPTGSNCDVSAFEDMLCNKQRIDLKSLYFGDIGLNDEDLQSKDYILSVLFAEYLNYEKKPVVATEQTKADGFIVYIQQELDGYVLRDEEGEKMISLPQMFCPSWLFMMRRTSYGLIRTTAISKELIWESLLMTKPSFP